jgi:hypothetical protein
LEVCIKQEQVYLGEGCWCWLGCCSLFSVICPDIHYNSFNYSVIARTSLLLGNKHKPLHHPLRVSIKEEQVYLGERCWSWLDCCSLFSVICPDIHYNCFNYSVMATTSVVLGEKHKPLHHQLDVWIKEEQVYLREGCGSWLGCCSLWFRYWSRFSLQLFQLLCNGHNFCRIGRKT